MAGETETRQRRTRRPAGPTPTANSETAPPARKGDPVVFISEHMLHHVIVRPAEEWYTNNGSRQTADKGVMLKFNNYRCTVPADLVDEVKALPCFTGQGEKKSVWVEGEWEHPRQPIQTVQGPILAGPRPVTAPPHPQWDSLSPAEIESIIGEGGVDLERALMWEKAQQNRAIVRRILAQRIIDTSDTEDVALEEPDGIPEQFGADEEASLTTEPGGIV